MSIAPELDDIIEEQDKLMERLLQELEATRIIGDEKQRRIVELCKQTDLLQRRIAELEGWEETK